MYIANFRKKSKHDIPEIRNSIEVIVPADNTRDLYKIEKEDYFKFLSENIRKTCKKSNKNKVNKLNLDAKKIANKLSTNNRVDWLQKNETYVTVKERPQKDFFRVVQLLDL